MSGSRQNGKLSRSLSRLRLRALERIHLEHERDWEGLRDVVSRFRPSGMRYPIYLNQVWSEWRGFLDFLTEDVHPRHILEIGAGRGGSSQFLTRVGGAGSLFISIDLFPEAAEYVALAKRYPGQEFHFLLADSHDPATFRRVGELLDGRKLDLLLIDGDHTYDGVKADFERYRELCGERGVIALHDIVPDHAAHGVDTDHRSGEVYRFWRELRAEHPHREFVEDPEQNGFGLGVLLRD